MYLSTTQLAKGIEAVHPGLTAFSMWMNLPVLSTTKSCSNSPVFLLTSWARRPGFFVTHDFVFETDGTSFEPLITKFLVNTLGNSVAASEVRLENEFLAKEPIAEDALRKSLKSKPLINEYCSRPITGIAVGPIFILWSVVKVK